MRLLTFLKTLSLSNAEINDFLNKNINSNNIDAVRFTLEQQMVDDIYTRLCYEHGAPDFAPVERYLKTNLIPRTINKNDIHDVNNYYNVISEIVHDVAGYLGANLNEEDFSHLHDWVDSSLKFSDLYKILLFKIAGDKLTALGVMDYLKTFSQTNGIHIDKFLGAPAEAKIISKTDIDTNDKFVFAILNTDLYDSMASMIVSCNHPDALYDYGFNKAEVSQIALLEIGDSINSTDYGKEVVVVRMK